MLDAALHRQLLAVMLLAAGCGPEVETFTQERERLACEIDVACGGEYDYACGDLEGYDKDRCQRYLPGKAEQCLADLEARLAEIEDDAATCDPNWTWSEACSDALDWRGARRGCGSVSGRPLQHEGQWVLAAVTHGHTWSQATPKASTARSELDRHAAERWLEVARAEHASVAAFARASLELMAVGAPPQLLEGCHRAALDEIGHARLALGLARALGDEAWDLGPLPLVPTRAVSLQQVAIDALIEGCLGEGGAAACAHVAADRAHGRAAEVVRTIAEEETQHAALAWATLRWALESDRSLAEPLAQAFDHALVQRRERARMVRASADAAAIHGLLGAEETAEIELDVAERVVSPVLARLLIDTRAAVRSGVSIS
jgi:hypothetical protein